MKAHERLLKYVTVHTASDEQSSTHPSSQCQLNLARLLAGEMRDLGLRNVRISEYGYVYGYLPATPDYESCPKIGFIAHMDTSPDAKGDGVRPQIIEQYDGRDVVLPVGGAVLSVERFPHLTSLQGRTLITTDGTTLLGADDKAGIAEILTACEILVREKIPHGRVCVGFTPDEEIGKGAEHFDIQGFGADFAYTMDGGPEGELEYENFNAAEATLEIQGVAVHPGTAKNIMVNALTVACEINSLLPGCETPAHTENYEGFYYLRKLAGTAEKASMAYSLRDHDRNLLAARKRTVQHIVHTLNERYGADTIRLEIVDRYQNMAEIIKEHSHLIDSAKLAMGKVGIEPVVIPMRGGTDGATLSYNGLPCPNLGTGGYAYHGALEHITAEGMEKCTRLIVELVRHYAKI
jgi:tripeptide aminopeptidase